MSDTAHVPEKYTHESNRWQQTLCSWTHFWKHWTNEDRTIHNQLRSHYICVWLAQCFKILWMCPVGPCGPGSLTSCPLGGTNWRYFTRHKRGNENERRWEERGRTQSKMSGQQVNTHLIWLFPSVSAVLHRCHNICVCSKYVCVPLRSNWCWV